MAHGRPNYFELFESAAVKNKTQSAGRPQPTLPILSVEPFADQT